MFAHYLCFNDVDFIIANYEAMREIFHNCLHLRSYVNGSSLFCNAANSDCNEKQLFVSGTRNSLFHQSLWFYFWTNSIIITIITPVPNRTIQYRILHLRDLTLFIQYQTHFKNLILFLFNVVFFIILKSMKYSVQNLNLNECQSFFV